MKGCTCIHVCTVTALLHPMTCYIQRHIITYGVCFRPGGNKQDITMYANSDEELVVCIHAMRSSGHDAQCVLWEDFSSIATVGS